MAAATTDALRRIGDLLRTEAFAEEQLELDSSRCRNKQKLCLLLQRILIDVKRHHDDATAAVHKLEEACCNRGQSNAAAAAAVDHAITSFLQIKHVNLLQTIGFFHTVLSAFEATVVSNDQDYLAVLDLSPTPVS